MSKRTDRLFMQEATILEATELICKTMQEKKIKRSQLAKRMNVSRGAVTHFLDGRNMTLRTLSNIFCAMGKTLVMTTKETPC